MLLRIFVNIATFYKRYKGNLNQSLRKILVEKFCQYCHFLSMTDSLPTFLRNHIRSQFMNATVFCCGERSLQHSEYPDNGAYVARILGVADVFEP